MKLLFPLLLAGVLLTAARAQTAPDQIGCKSDPNADQKKTLLLRGFKPVSMLTSDEYFDYWGVPGQGRFEISGLALPDEVLEKLYHKNAEHLFSQFHPDSVTKSTRGAQ